jgi:hypothetical protein
MIGQYATSVDEPVSGQSEREGRTWTPYRGRYCVPYIIGLTDISNGMEWTPPHCNGPWSYGEINLSLGSATHMIP